MHRGEDPLPSTTLLNAAEAQPLSGLHLFSLTLPCSASLSKTQKGERRACQGVWWGVKQVHGLPAQVHHSRAVGPYQVTYLHPHPLYNLVVAPACCLPWKRQPFAKPSAESAACSRRSVNSLILLIVVLQNHLPSLKFLSSIGSSFLGACSDHSVALCGPRAACAASSHPGGHFCPGSVPAQRGPSLLMQV